MPNGSAAARVASTSGGRDIERGGQPAQHYHTGAATGAQTTPVRNSKGVVVGHIESGWLVKRRLSYRRHHLHRYGAWASDEIHIAELRRQGGHGVRLHLDDGRMFESSLADWDLHAFAINHDGPQLALPDRWWRVTAPNAPRQLALMGVAV